MKSFNFQQISSDIIKPIYEKAILGKATLHIAAESNRKEIVMFLELA